MTTQYTSNVLNNILNVVDKNNAQSSPNLFNTKTDKQFSGFLDNSLKSYADKSQQKTASNYSNPAYAEKTKNAQNAAQSNSAQNNKTENNNKVKNSSEENAFKTADRKTENRKSESPKTDEPKQNKDKIGDKNSGKENNPSTLENTAKEDTPDVESNEITKEGETLQSGTEISIQNVVENTALLTAANESIIANIQFDDVLDTATPQTEPQTTEPVSTEKQQTAPAENKAQTAPESTETAPVITKQAEDAIKTVAASAIENLESLLSAENNKPQTINLIGQQTETEPMTALPVQNELATKPDVKTTQLPQDIQTTQDIEVDVKTAEKPLTEATPTQKETKPAFNADNSKIILNLDESTVAEEPVQQPVAVTPADTEPEKAPVIKVTQEVAASTKESTVNSFVENKDVSSKIKSKAVSDMMSLENTDTVVTQAQTNTNSNTNTGSQTSLGGQNAGEQVAKMSVENSTQPLNGSEAFINRLDKSVSPQLIGKASASNQAQQLNQNDIMNQVNSQFDEMQKSGNNKVSIILKPENLGRVALEIMNSKDGIVAKMTTDNQQVKELFDKNVEALKSNLSSQGISVNNIKVECTQESSQHSMGFEREQFNQNASRDPNGQRQASQNNQTSENHSNGYGESLDAEFAEATQLKNTETIIQHNGKVDYKV